MLSMLSTAWGAVAGWFSGGLWKIASGVIIVLALGAGYLYHDGQQAREQAARYEARLHEALAALEGEQARSRKLRARNALQDQAVTRAQRDRRELRRRADTLQAQLKEALDEANEQVQECRRVDLPRDYVERMCELTGSGDAVQDGACVRAEGDAGGNADPSVAR